MQSCEVAPAAPLVWHLPKSPYPVNVPTWSWPAPWSPMWIPCWYSNPGTDF